MAKSRMLVKIGMMMILETILEMGGLGREGALPYKAILGRVAAGCYNALD